MRKAFTTIALVYLGAAIIGGGTGYLFRGQHPFLVSLVADVAATVVVFVFSALLGNSSIYDPYWSVAPVAIALYWVTVSQTARAITVRQAVVLILVGVWAIRLTGNWARRWRGLEDEDWRYTKLRTKHRGAYWLVSFWGIHMMPTLLVYLGCLALFPALVIRTRSFGILDVAAILVSGAAIWIEARADQELWKFRVANQQPGAIIQTGLWKYSRHPNYLGEMAFWWGLYLFALAAAPRYGWTIIGPFSITCLFLFISIPMIERHMLERRPGYTTQIKTTPKLIPWPPRDTQQR